MLTSNSRYYRIEIAEYQTTTVDGRLVTHQYIRRRFLPPADTLPLQSELQATRDDRLDLIAAQTLGDAEQFWQICDANNAMHPEDLLSETVQVLRIPIPQPMAQ